MIILDKPECHSEERSDVGILSKIVSNLYVFENYRCFFKIATAPFGPCNDKLYAILQTKGTCEYQLSAVLPD